MSTATRLPARTSLELQDLLLPYRPANNGFIDVTIGINDRNLNLRDLSRFLQLIDQSYGRIVSGNLRKYAWDEGSQLRVSQMRHGSWEVVLSQALSLVSDPSPIVVIFLLLKLMPKALDGIAGTAQKLATGYNQYEQGRLARVNRKKLRAEIENVAELAPLPTKQRNQVVEVIDVLLRQDPSVSNPAQDFSIRSVRRVSIRVRDRSE